MRKNWIKLIIMIMVTLTMSMSAVGVKSASAATNDKLFKGFQNPPASARPGVYWWWNGNAVTEKEITRELDLLHDAGIGSVLIFPLMTTIGAKQTEAKELQWLSPEWFRMLKFTVEGAKKRGMEVDLLVGTGWPFGGPFIKEGEQIQMIQLGKKAVHGPGVFEGKLKDLMVTPKGAYGEDTNGSKPQLKFMRLMKKDLKEFEPGIDLKDKIAADGTVKFDIPTGDYEIYTGTWKEGHVVVNISAPGGSGPAIDHYSAKPLQNYLAHFTREMEKNLGKGFAKNLRSLHCDSFEFTGANWTDDLFQQFQQRRGYDLEPYFPFVLDWPGYQNSSPMSDTINRVRHDMWLTLEEVFLQRFMHPFNEWCHKQGTAMRVEAYGCPSTDELNAKMIGDFPMGEVWITDYVHTPPNHPCFPAEDKVSSASMCLWGVPFNKYESSAAHLNDKHVVAAETMTNDMSAFRTTLQNFKQGCDANIITGINQHIFHGYNLNPAEAGFPGWFYCGEYVDSKNSWWPYFNKLNDYLARVSWVMQQSTSHAELAVFDMDAEHWFWEAAHQCGYSTDYVNEQVLREANLEGGKIHYGPNTYDALVVCKVYATEPAMAQAIERYAKAGGKIIFIENYPTHRLGMSLRGEDEAVKAASESALKVDPSRVAVVPAPKKGGEIEWVRATLPKFGLQPTVEISNPDPLLYQVHQRLDDRDIFFFENLSPTKPAAFTGRFATGEKTPWVWNAETGERSVYPSGKTKNELAINLKPLESILLVFEPKLTGKPKLQPVVDASDFVELKTSWQVKFTPVEGKAFDRALPSLINLIDDPQLAIFSGSAVYRTEFTANDKQHAMLDLGRVCEISEVTLNGKPLGVRWWGEHTYDLRKALKSGQNVLEVKVTTTLSNYVRSLKDNVVANRWVIERKRQPLPSGLIGPVRLLKMEQL